MGRGKFEIKKIENPTSRQVTYSKRRNGMFKKAQELAVLCDAKISLVLISNSGKFHEFTSPNTTTKKIYDQYQRTLGIDLWSTHYERMQEHLRKLMEINSKLRRQIRQRMGQDLDVLSMEELRGLEPEIVDSLSTVRERKYHVIKTQTETYRKKVRNLEERHGNLLMHFDAKCEDSRFGLADNYDENYDTTAAAFANGVSNFYTFRHQPDHPYDLRLA